MGEDHCNLTKIDQRLDEVTATLAELKADLRVIKESMAQHDQELDGNGGPGLKTRVAVIEKELEGTVERQKQSRRILTVALVTLCVNLFGGLLLLVLQFCLGCI